jgi:cell division septation protein DedD
MREGAMLVLAGIFLLAGCANSPATSSQDEPLALEAISPEDTEVTVDEGETVTFVATCDSPGPPKNVVVEWEHAIRDERVEDAKQDFTTSANESAFTVSFEETADQLVTAVCTTDDDRTQPRVWNVTVRADG